MYKCFRNVKVIATMARIIIVSLLATLIFSTNHASATDSVVDEINLTVPVSCTLSGTGMNTHTAEIQNTQYNSAIGETILKAFCNDKDGFAIYAIGYTDNQNGKNVLTDSNLDSSRDIPTGTLTSGDNSQWAMKLSTVTSPEPTYPITIENNYDDFHNVPSDYELVAKRTSGTDIGVSAEGTTLKTTYQAYAAPNQAAGTYNGQVKYTLVHPNGTNKPASSMLIIGEEVNTKMKTLAAGTNTSYGAQTTDIKAIRMADSLPAGFIPSEANTVSTPDSKYPVYIFFDDTNDAGIIYFYTEGDTITMNPNSRFMFLRNMALADISGLANWDSSYVTTLRTAFRETSITSLDALANWDVSNVTEFEQTFRFVSSLNDISALANWNVSSATTMRNLFAADTSLLDLSPVANWDTSNVKDLSYLFEDHTTITDISPLANWDTSNVTNLRGTFYNTASLANISALANWDTSKVTDMYGLFYKNASLADLSPLANWNTGKVTNMYGAFQSLTSLVSLAPLANWDTSSVTDMHNLFRNDTSLVDASALANWNTSNVTDMKSMFHSDSALTTVDVSNWDTGNVTTMAGMFTVGSDFVGDGQLREIIGIEDLDTSNVTDMTTMFYGAGQMTHYDIANWDVSKVESLNHMFCDNFKLESLDLSKWDVSSVKTMYDMFDDDNSLTTIGDVSHWNTASLIDIGGWLNGATSFVGDNGTLDLSGWDTSHVKVTGEMFRATKLQTIDLSGWNFGSVINGAWDGAGEGIYYEYGNLQAVYQGFSVMFQNIPTLTKVYVSQSGLNSFNTAVNNGAKTTNMWSGSGASSFTVK